MKMAGKKLFVLGTIAAALSCASAFDSQKPLTDPLEQDPLAVDVDADVVAPTLNADNLDQKPLVSSEKLQAKIDKHSLLSRAKELYEIAKASEDEYNHPTRVIGSPGHVGTLEYISSAINELGDYYRLWNQSFPAYSGRILESRLVLGHDVPESAIPLQLTPPTKNRQPVYGDLVLVANEGCDASDYPAEVSGNIAFVLRGTCPYGDKSELAGRAGALAAVVYNYEDGEVHGTLQSPSPDHVATFSLSGRDAAPVLKRLRAGDAVDSIAYIDAEVKTTITHNLLAQTVGGDPNNCVMLGGHSDSVEAGPGINDDGSGSLSVLEVAKHLTDFRVNNCVRFAWWSGEEEGLLGSDYYVSQLSEEENLKIRLFMDYDMMGSPNFAYQVYNATNAVNPAGSEELRDLYVEWYASQGLNHSFIPFDGRSDYDGFIRNGIPGGGVATGAEGVKTADEEERFGGSAGQWYDPCYHQLCDDVGNVNLTAWEVNTKLIAHSVATYAVSLDSFPKRTLSYSTDAYEREAKYHGPSPKI